MPNSNHIHIKCIIVDDEPMARDVIRRYIEKIPNLKLVSEFGNAIDATIFLQEQSVDMIFLDIKMPQLSGTEFVRSLRNVPKIIFTTAYKEFAHEAFDLNACDYLLKPFSLERFIQAIDKVRDRLSQQEKSAEAEPFTYIKTDGRIVKIPFNELLYAEASGNNVKIVMADQQLTPAMTFLSFEELLPKSKFIRVHRSFIVNRTKIRAIEGNRIMIGSIEIPIGANYRAAFLK